MTLGTGDAHDCGHVTHLDVDTRTLLAMPYRDCTHGGITPAINLSATYAQPTDGTKGIYEYQRCGNPTVASTEQLLGRLEGAEYTYGFATGMAAVTAALSLLKAGDHVVFCANLYGGTYNHARHYFPRHGITFELVDDLNALTAVPDSTAMVFVESPTNPNMRIIDLAHTVELARAVGARVVVDNTFLTAYVQRPLDFGVDLVLYSATKYLNGHDDALGGFCLTNDEEIAEGLKFSLWEMGAALSPFSSYLIGRGLKTLTLRMDQQLRNAEVLVAHLKDSEHLKSLYWAGSYSAEEAAIHQAQTTGPNQGRCGIFSFELADHIDRSRFLEALQIVTFAVSLGGLGTLICHPASQTHESFDDNDLAQSGISPALLRCSVGIEQIDDVIADIDQAFAAATGH